MFSEYRPQIQLILAFCILSVPATLNAADWVAPEDASEFIGMYAEVCGIVASATYAERDAGKPTFLNLNRAFPDHIFTVVIWGSNRSKFSYRPETLEGRRICVEGKIEEYKGRPQIEVYQPSQIRQSDTG